MTLSTYFYSWDIWQLYHKVTFDGQNKLILINEGETGINVGQDLYSDWKEWAGIRDYLKFEPAMSSIGGNPTTGGDFAGSTYFLINDWKVRTWEGDHSLTVSGNLFSEDGSAPFIPTVFSHTVTYTSKVSNLVDKVTANVSNIAEGVWDALSSLHLVPGSMGESLGNLDVPVSSRAGQISVDSLRQGQVAATATAVSGTATEIHTTLTQSSNFFDGMLVQIINAAGVAVRRVDEYQNNNGVIFVDDPFPFSPTAGDSILILTSHDSRTGEPA